MGYFWICCINEKKKRGVSLLAETMKNTKKGLAYLFRLCYNLVTLQKHLYS